MPIVSSIVALNNVQVDGRSQILEIHADNLGNQYQFDYLADPGTDTNSIMLNRVATIDANLTSSEIMKNIAQGMTQGANATLTFNDSTIQQNISALANAFSNATSDEIISMTEFLISLPSETVASVFGLTNDELSALESNTESFSTAIETLASGLQNAIQGGLSG